MLPLLRVAAVVVAINLESELVLFDFVRIVEVGSEKRKYYKYFKLKSVRCNVEPKKERYSGENSIFQVSLL